MAPKRQLNIVQDLLIRHLLITLILTTTEAQPITEEAVQTTIITATTITQTIIHVLEETAAVIPLVPLPILLEVLIAVILMVVIAHGIGRQTIATAQPTQTLPGTILLATVVLLTAAEAQVVAVAEVAHAVQDNINK